MELKDTGFSENRGSQLTREYLQSLGFVDGQRLPHYKILFKNEGLYNMDGEKIGWGDLSSEHVGNLIKTINEPLFLLGEHSSYWNNVSIMQFDNTPEGHTKLVPVSNKSKEMSPGLTEVLSELQAIVLPYSVNPNYPPGIYRFPNFDDNFKSLDVEETVPGVKKIVVEGVDTFIVRKDSAWRVMGEMLPMEIKQKVDKKFWGKLYPKRPLVERFRDRFSK